MNKWDGWMASPTEWTWVWVSSGSWWWTFRPDVLQSMSRKQLDMTERLNWTDWSLELFTFYAYLYSMAYFQAAFWFVPWTTHIYICQKIWKTLQRPQDWKNSVFIPVPKKSNVKESSNYHTIALISHTSKVVLKVLQARLQQYVNNELPGVQAGFRKGRETIDQIANIR